MRKRKHIAVFLALILVLAGLPNFSHAADFKDIGGHWARKNILWAAKEGYIKGYPDGTFKPNAPITKAEYYRITNQFIKKNTNKVDAELPVPTGGITFSDVQTKDWFYNEVQIGIQAGYIDTAEESGKLNPTEAILREEATWIFAKNQDWPENPSAAGRMLDFNEISENRKGLVGSAIEHRVIRGNDKGYFMPKKTLTRAEVVTIIAQFLHPDGVPGPDPSPNPAPQGAWYWSFNNSSPNFSQGYKVNPQVLNKFTPYCSSSDATIIRQQMRKGWGGSCYGMAATSGLYREGRFKVTGLNSPNRENINEIQPQSNYNAQSMINIYQLSQFTKAVWNKEYAHATGWKFDRLKNNTNDLKTYGENVKRMINQAKSENSSVQLAYFWPNAGHANTIYDYKEAPGKLILKVYDPNYPGLDNKEVVLDFNRGTMSAESASNAGYGSGTIRIGASYCMPTKYIMQGVKDTPALQDLVKVLVYGDRTVTLRSGSESWILSPDKGQPGLDSKTYTYYVPKRDSYTVDGQGALSLNISGKDYTVAFDTDGFSRARITPRSVNLEGQKGAYYLNVAKDEGNKSFKWQGMEVSGKDGQRLALTKEDFGFTLRGDQISGSRITALDKFQENNKNYTGKDQMVQIRQNGNDIQLIPNKYGNYDVLPSLDDELVGSWIGRDSFTYNRVPYGSEATLFISRNSNGTYKVVNRIEVPALKKQYAVEYNQVNFNKGTRELELRRNQCRILEGPTTLRGANAGLKLSNGQLNTTYNNGRTAHYTRF